MADVYGVNATIIAAGTVNGIDPELSGGAVRVIYDEYEASALASGSILMGPTLPIDAVIVDWKLDIDAIGTTGIELGTKSDTDCLMAKAVGTSAALFDMSTNGVAMSTGKVIASGDDQQLCVTTSGGTTGSGTIKLVVVYATKK